MPAPPRLDWSGNAPFPFTRESKIRLDADGRFFHEGALVEHPGLAAAMHTWISRHPDDGRYVLENGWDWCYVTVDDAPFVVRSTRAKGDAMILALSDGTEEVIDPHALRVDEAGAIRCEVHATRKGGPYPARFDRHATAALAESIHEEDGQYVLSWNGAEVRLD